MMPRYSACLLLIALAGPAALAAAGEAELVELSLEELGRLDVAALSRKAQKLSDTPAAVTVLSAEDIRRSGARSVPEALREVPGMNVAQIGGGRWAVGVRGFEGRFSNKLLVQIDGRSVYSPLFSGVFWEALDVMLEDVERIEVIRGPGASLWGANAVNGVINIVTRKAGATRGSLVTVGLDQQGRAQTALREGRELDGIGALRVYVKGSELTRSRSADGHAALDDGRGWQAGFRLDGAGAGVDAWTLQGNTYRRTSSENIVAAPGGGYGGLVPLQFEFEGSNLTGRYNWGLAGGEASVQAYVDQQRSNIAAYGNGRVDTVDLDFQHRLVPAGRHEVMWGLGARHTRTEILPTTSVLGVQPPRQTVQVGSTFVQDEISLVPQRLKLTLGGRFEYSSLSRFEPQPTARLMWTPSPADSLWTSWSRAARTPSIGEAYASILFDLRSTPFGPVAVVSRPGAGWQPHAERLDALEMGYRRNLGNGSFEAVVFHHDYRRLIGEHLGALGGPVPIPVAPGMAPAQYLERSNGGRAHSHGLELGLDLPLSARLRLQASYTLLQTHTAASADPVASAAAEALENAAPSHWASLHALVGLARGHELDLMLRRIGAIGQGQVPAYTSVDVRYGWRLERRFELAVVLQNLFDPVHLEYVSNFFPGQPAYQPRRAHVQGLWRF